LVGSQAPADFFGDFHEGESSYDEDALRLPQGWDANPDNADAKLGGPKAAEFYDESQSGGAKQAWQTHYPSLTDGVGNRMSSVGKWTVDGDGHWKQDYQASAPAGDDPRQQKLAGWFDSRVNQYDGYGRHEAPSAAALGEADADSFVERDATSTLVCKEAGCTAKARLQVFNGSVEKAKNCRLSLHVHPTDFDDQYSGERLTFIKVNGMTVSNDCFPMISGCNKSTQRPMFACLRDLSLDNVIGEDGLLEVEAQISDVVDECPFEGNLLSGVPSVSCLVASKTSTPERVPAVPAQPIAPEVPKLPAHATALYIEATAPLRCPERGCTATANVQIDTSKLSVKECLMDVFVHQTDFDGQDGTVETVEFVKLGDHATLKRNVAPGGNPCRKIWQGGAKLTELQTEYPVVTAENVTGPVLAGSLQVTAKISDHVDECAHDGYLLNGYVQVNCSVHLHTH
jgi:hypothetical protein